MLTDEKTGNSVMFLFNFSPGATSKVSFATMFVFSMCVFAKSASKIHDGVVHVDP